MTQALSALSQNFRPSPLQEAAINRIHEFQKELKRYGYAMRSGMELEFLIQDADARLVPVEIKLDSLNQRLQNIGTLEHLETVKKDHTAAYEAILGDQVPGNPDRAAVKYFSPVGVAAETVQLKRELKKILEASTCYSPPVSGSQPYRPVFHAYPYSMSNEYATSEDYARNTAGLHVNVSLYTLDGQNAFSKDRDLVNHCAQTLVEVQNEAALAFLPKNNSLRRLGRQVNYAVPGGLGMEIVDPREKKRTSSSVNIRGGIFEVGGPRAQQEFRHASRIENRLPGADADPFVALAVTMAAMVETLRQRERGKTASRYDPRHDLPRERAAMAEDLERSQHMRELLGEELHRALVESYHSPGKTR